MPLFAILCPQCGSQTSIFEHTIEDFGCRTILCDCGSTMAPTLSLGRGLTYFSEKKPRIIHNLGHDPITITSHEQHKEEMRKAGVEWAPPRRGMPGCWGS